MLHQALQTTAPQGYPAIKSILKNSYEGLVDGIDDAKISAVDLGARSYGFIVQLPDSSSVKDKDLFLKIQIPFHSSKSLALQQQEAETQKTTFEFMEYASSNSSGDVFIPKVLRDHEDQFVPHIEAGDSIPLDLIGSELVLMTKAKGQAITLSAEGQKALQDFQLARPGKRTDDLFRDDANYSAESLSKMATTIAEMHVLGSEFLETREVPTNPTYDLRTSDQIYSDLNRVFSCDIAALSPDEIDTKISETQGLVRSNALNSLKEIAPHISLEFTDDQLAETINAEAKKLFLSQLSEEVQKRFSDKGHALPFSVGLEIAIREKTLDSQEIKLGRRLQQVDETLSFCQGDKMRQTILTAQNLSEIYRRIEDLPKTVLHNDTNATNFLYDEASGQIALIDFDTLGHGARISDLMTHHMGSHATAKTIVAAYDSVSPLTAQEQEFGPHIVECITFDKLAETLGRFFDIEKMREPDHLNSLGWGIDDAYSRAKSWGEKEKIDLKGITAEVREESAKSEIVESSESSFVERVDLKKFNKEKKSWVERIHSDPTKGKSLGGSNDL